jgi:hypothetical protein
MLAAGPGTAVEDPSPLCRRKPYAKLVSDGLSGGVHQSSDDLGTRGCPLASRRHTCLGAPAGSQPDRSPELPDLSVRKRGSRRRSSMS